MQCTPGVRGEGKGEGGKEGGREGRREEGRGIITNDKTTSFVCIANLVTQGNMHRVHIKHIAYSFSTDLEFKKVCLRRIKHLQREGTSCLM